MCAAVILVRESVPVEALREPKLHIDQKRNKQKMNETENSVMAEALAAAGEIQVSPPKIPEGSTLIGIKLARDPAVKNRYMVPVLPGTSWKSEGMAVAIKDGSTVAAKWLAFLL